ncbi:glycogen phosphorylase [bacterium (Candidatus Blackallbacteria) CG17_big_fil_post_rev_8_21_14_2_50_48_46]|uniref:Alpha-1,4 glucan phosphorylase n=1 Tax=bacterium (Candidatus Blackallbacteria) CG17_big_fil_post_rev_8_21_14_2_50_48_46 TaxID=2014261 RepID=A0A2M7G3U8_9BACT|nr:MAG: glycogen phosphorylase [bacterium (Candidatus Blackallbacteria) CG18_big_fil_WC_8_21_14_2_50_49_26]PIW16533.1 MAG: glycogen phosphorylase [bacterium (Candidatus Blackallbacteria) CG17_big_fil_post_rev_8_21_14_2_50_48_46]PIW46041.1 MAG: glycogen phosphorylase [bacterium (Candidatus Blackallbacteria) CG13_big_fil_rev_8_21_14_2_50_49_14]
MPHRLPNPRTGMEIQSIETDIREHLRYTLAEDKYSSTQWDNYQSLVLAVLDRVHDRWLDTQDNFYQKKSKQVYYLSMEYLVGRLLDNCLINLGIQNETRQALKHLGLDFDQIRSAEWDAGLGNGGLGRLAACFLDSMATQGIAGMGYGIRFDYGMFFQKIHNGYQIESPDQWLRYGNPWDIVRPEVQFKINFYGNTSFHEDSEGEVFVKWENTEKVLAVAYDTPIPGYRNDKAITLRLWKAEAINSLDLTHFNQGEYINAMRDKTLNENISRVLYPNDKEFVGQELRLKQEYFMVAAALQDIFRRFKKMHTDLRKFPDAVAIQCNDTHPNLAIVELMRILIDIERLPWDLAWEITTRTISYTNHTLLPEALEKWPVSLMRLLLPRHLELLYEINRRFLSQITLSSGDDLSSKQHLSIITQGEAPMVQMGHLGVVAAHRVNGVSAVHSDLMTKTIFRDFAELWPEKFINVTNGVTPRRWIKQSNPLLSDLITDKVGLGWVKQLDEIKQLEKYADDAGFQKEIWDIKQKNKATLAAYLKNRHGFELNPHAIFDVQIKRIHEYKRQLLAALHTIVLYNRIKADPEACIHPRTLIFAGKAAPGYAMAKLHIKLINSIGEKINHDPDMQGKLQCFFIPNYNVSLAEHLFPASDLSEQISTAGFEASGTGNMKFALNGALTIGTLDGATIEMMDFIGRENMFIFGLSVDEVRDLRISGYQPELYVKANPELELALNQLREGVFSPEDPALFEPILGALLERGDYFMVLADFEAYAQAQETVAQLYRDKNEWSRRAILNIARMGYFSSDRTILEYASKVWDVKPVT